MLTLVLALISPTLAEFATNTNDFNRKLSTCVSRVDSDIECLTSVRDGLEKMSDYIQHVITAKLSSLAHNGILLSTFTVSLSHFGAGGAEREGIGVTLQ